MNRPVFVLLAFGLAAAIFAVSQVLSPQAFTPRAEAAPNTDFQHARQMMQQGDGFRRSRDWDKAKKCYDEAEQGFKAANTQRFIVAAQAMCDLCVSMPKLDLAKMKDGAYQGSQMGYVADVTVEVTVKGGKISTMRIVSTKESRALKSLETVPQQIVTKKTPSVDACSGATITSCAVMGATVKAIEQAQPPDKTKTKPMTD